MSMQAHLSQLQTRHRSLDEAIHSARQNPSTDSAEIAAMKRRKLRVKDEIARLGQGT